MALTKIGKRTFQFTKGKGNRIYVTEKGKRGFFTHFKAKPVKDVKAFARRRIVKGIKVRAPRVVRPITRLTKMWTYFIAKSGSKKKKLESYGGQKDQLADLKIFVHTRDPTRFTDSDFDELREDLERNEPVFRNLDVGVSFGTVAFEQQPMDKDEIVSFLGHLDQFQWELLFFDKGGSIKAKYNGALR